MQTCWYRVHVFLPLLYIPYVYLPLPEIAIHAPAALYHFLALNAACSTCAALGWSSLPRSTGPTSKETPCSGHSSIQCVLTSGLTPWHLTRCESAFIVVVFLALAAPAVVGPLFCQCWRPSRVKQHASLPPCSPNLPCPPLAHPLALALDLHWCLLPPWWGPGMTLQPPPLHFAAGDVGRAARLWGLLL